MRSNDRGEFFAYLIEGMMTELVLDARGPSTPTPVKINRRQISLAYTQERGFIVDAEVPGTVDGQPYQPPEGYVTIT